MQTTEERRAAVLAELPEGFELRAVNRVSPATARRVPLQTWGRELRKLLDAGAHERWVPPSETGWGSAAGVVSGVHARGGILIAEKGSRKLYRLTELGVLVAREPA